MCHQFTIRAENERHQITDGEGITKTIAKRILRGINATMEKRCICFVKKFTAKSRGRTDIVASSLTCTDLTDLGFVLG